MSLETANLVLDPCVPSHIIALIETPDRFEEMTGMPAAAGLREMYASDDVSPEWLATLRASAVADPWQHGFFIIHRDVRVVIGSAGFKGPPDASGIVEIAYGIAPGFQGQGYATEAARALIEFAQRSPRVLLIRAHTLPGANASTRVLPKCGFTRIGTIIDPADGPVWRWERLP